MLLITKKIEVFLEKEGLTQYKFAQVIDYSRGALGSMMKGRDAFPDSVIEKMASVLKVSVDEIKGWIIADKYSKETIKLAIQAKKEKLDDKLILTTKLDELLDSKNISRTSLSKIIDYSQGSLNDVIIGKKSISKSVISRLAATLEITEEQITSWIIADKYTLESLKVALKAL